MFSLTFIISILRAHLKVRTASEYHAHPSGPKAICAFWICAKFSDLQDKWLAELSCRTSELYYRPISLCWSTLTTARVSPVVPRPISPPASSGIYSFVWRTGTSSGIDTAAAVCAANFGLKLDRPHARRRGGLCGTGWALEEETKSGGRGGCCSRSSNRYAVGGPGDRVYAA